MGKRTMMLWTILLGVFCGIAGARERLDGIAAVVGDSIILFSELEAYTLLRMNAAGMRSDSLNIDSLRRQCLEEMIDGRVFIVRAEKDTTISITAEEVEEAMQRSINTILTENRLTLQELEEELQRTQKMSLSEFRRQMRRSIREQLLKQKLQQRYLAGLRLSRSEVEAFYAEYGDSLPSAGPSIRLSKLEIALTPSDSARRAAFDRIRKIKELIAGGSDFTELAKKYSEDPNASEGGDLGFIAKGTLSELAFEQKAFSLEPGQVSDIVETRLGFHLLKVEEKKDQRVHVRQILIRLQPSQQRIAAVRALLDSIRLCCREPDKFAEAVRTHSTDQPTKVSNGDMGWVSPLELAAPIRAAIDTLPQGAVSEIVELPGALAIFRVVSRSDERRYSLEDDWNLIEEKAKDIWAQKRLVDLVKKWRKDIFVDIRCVPRLRL